MWTSKKSLKQTFSKSSLRHYYSVSIINNLILTKNTKQQCHTLYYQFIHQPSFQALKEKKKTTHRTWGKMNNTHSISLWTFIVWFSVYANGPIYMVKNTISKCIVQCELLSFQAILLQPLLRSQIFISYMFW